MKISIKFEKRDIWIGVFNDLAVTDRIYICIIPCFPIILDFTSRRYKGEE